ncbi:MAG: DUF1345 domain-containing protein [Rhodospirillales bacterium]|nr:DUF1345 domain-containing protein [Rhodospirillales bacterium]MDE1883021.1 DUF1345 domain-containing protein [Rhodospirillales bacterium]
MPLPALVLRLYRILRARPYFTICYGVGALAWVLMFAVKNPAIRSVAAWDIGSLLYLAVTLTMFFLTENRDISLDAKSHQEGEWTVFTLTLLGAAMSFVSLFLFSHAANQKAHFTGAYLAFVVVTLTLSWAVTHLTFAYRYAHEYYSYDMGRENVDGGIEFPKDERPDYLDFVYFSFVLGMTFQVSDCNVTSKKLRRLATVQGLIGFLFNTVILALSVNIAAGLL